MRLVLSHPLAIPHRVGAGTIASRHPLGASHSARRPFRAFAAKLSAREASRAPIAQLAEADDLKSSKSGFEPQSGHSDPQSVRGGKSPFFWRKRGDLPPLTAIAGGLVGRGVAECGLERPDGRAEYSGGEKPSAEGTSRVRA